MKEKYQLFYSWVLSQGIELSDKTNPYQCMDLAYSWVFFLNFPKATIQHLYAYEVFTLPNDLTTQYFELIPNSSTFVPQVGDIAVFDKTSTNIAGHISVCTGDGDTNTFSSLDQNWAGNSKATLVKHGYDSPKLLGVLRPKLKSEVFIITDQTKIPQIVDENGNQMEVQAIRGRITDWARQITSQLTEINDLKKVAESLQTQLNSLPPNTSSAVLLAIRSILYGKGFWWTKLWKLKELLPVG